MRQKNGVNPNTNSGLDAEPCPSTPKTLAKAEELSTGEVNGGVIPSGFANAKEFADFDGKVRAGLKTSGYSDIEPI